MGDDVVNNPLALAQHVTKFLDENQAVSYLLAIESLGIESWKSAKDFLPGVNTVNRQWKEGHIRDIVQVFCNQEVEKSFLLRDLSLLPGCDRYSIETASFIASSMYSVQTIAARIASQNPSRMTGDLQTTQQPTAFPSLSCNNAFPKETGNRGNLQSTKTSISSLAAPNGHQSPTANLTNTYVEKSNRKAPQKRTWYHGSYQSTNREKHLPLTSVCLAVKSGSNETMNSLKEELKQWNYRDLTAEAVTITDRHTLFRVKFKVSTVLRHKWKEDTSWPTRMSVSLWRGNPASVLKPPQERQYRKCIYIGNLPPSASLDQITENVKHIYAGEIASNTVKDVEALINQEGTEHTMSKSVCVVLTSPPGQDLPLKQDHYPYHLRKNVRVWRGRPPWPENHAMAKAKIELPHAW